MNSNDTVYSSRIWKLSDSCSILAHDVGLRHSRIQRTDHLRRVRAWDFRRLLLTYHHLAAEHSITPEVYFSFSPTRGEEVILTIYVQNTPNVGFVRAGGKMSLIQFDDFLRSISSLRSEATGFHRFGHWYCGKSHYVYEVPMDHRYNDVRLGTLSGLDWRDGLTVYAHLNHSEAKRLFVSHSDGVVLVTLALSFPTYRFQMWKHEYDLLLSRIDYTLEFERHVSLWESSLIRPMYGSTRAAYANWRRAMMPLENFVGVNWLKEGF